MDSNDSNSKRDGSQPEERRPNNGLFLVPKNPLRPKEKFKTFLSGGQVMIQSEFTDQLEALTIGYMAQYAPATATEVALVKDLATTRCRCEYVARLRTNPAIARNEKIGSTLVRYHTTNQRQFKRSLKMLQAIQKERLREAARRPQLVKPKTVGEY